MPNQIPVVTIDGPSGSGKGTVSQWLAEKLGWHWLDSGVLYRVLGLAATQHQIDWTHEAALEVLAEHLDVRFVSGRVVLEGQDVTDVIRTESCGNMASKVGALPNVRRALLARQRAFRQAPGLVTDGRDMGTVVFPDAEVKLYLDADQKERAERRQLQLRGKGINATLDQLLAELAERDIRDKGRGVAPLKPAEDALVVDTTGMSIQMVLEKVLSVVDAKHLSAVGG